jgi:hypothetical protein
MRVFSFREVRMVAILPVELQHPFPACSVGLMAVGDSGWVDDQAIQADRFGELYLDRDARIVTAPSRGEKVLVERHASGFTVTVYRTRGFGMRYMQTGELELQTRKTYSIPVEKITVVAD